MQPTKRQRNSTSNPTEGPFDCRSCGKSFSRIENLTRHAENRAYPEIFPFDVLKRHLKLHQASEDHLATSASPPVQRSLAVDGAPQPDQSPGNESSDICSRADAPWPGDSVSRNNQQRYTTAPSAAYHSPLSHPSYPSVSDGYYGVYGEGSFNADLGWILDIAPSDFMTPLIPTSDYPSQTNVLAIPTLPTNQNGHNEPVDETHQATIEDTNNWPDVDGSAESTILQEVPAATVPGSDEWVEEHEILSCAGTFGERRVPYVEVDADLRTRILVALQQESSVKHGLLPPDEAKFPAPGILEHFLRLFFQYVHPRFPVTHRPTFSTSTAPPFLLLAMMLLGSSHSETNGGRFTAVYLRPVVTMFSRMQALNTAFLRETDNILTLLFLCVAAAWCGHKFAFEFAEGARGILVTACRRCKLLDCRQKLPLSGDAPQSMRARLHLSWQSWINMEQRKRLGLSIHTFDLQFPALFHNQPYISKGETVNLVLPCADAFWEARSAAAWKVLLGPAEIPPSTYFMVPLDTCLLYPATKREAPYAPIDSFGRTMLIYALFTHIFEWRQSLNIVLHSAFIRGPERNGPGEGLMERQKWLREGLDAWLSTYHPCGDPAPDAALLLHFLAKIHLDINVSDLHLFAGRSGLSEDINLAEDSLRRWCRSQDSTGTMHNVYEMLSLAYRIIENGNEHQCGFEISVALFTGGLTCWMYAKLGGQSPVGLQINMASNALEKMSCWGICSNFAQILKRFIE
ncbi:fungal-specific transcription factor domain-containing protein [Aspergillus granulosus]|uniref:Fungal-specific transcription factor domain-containing protein n=1 Tax=Aspergillus granulosus TaxID=176169 RepID=A0ABR4H8Z0_9EURO